MVKLPVTSRVATVQSTGMAVYFGFASPPTSYGGCDVQACQLVLHMHSGSNLIQHQIDVLHCAVPGMEEMQMRIPR